MLSSLIYACELCFLILQRLYHTFVNYQNKYQESNKIQIFIQKTLSPVRHADDQVRFENYRVDINKRLLFTGLDLQENGKFRRVSAAYTIPEAQQRADALKSNLKDRQVPGRLTFLQSRIVTGQLLQCCFRGNEKCC